MINLCNDSNEIWTADSCPKTVVERNLGPSHLRNSTKPFPLSVDIKLHIASRAALYKRSLPEQLAQIDFIRMFTAYSSLMHCLLHCLFYLQIGLQVYKSTICL